MCYREGKIKRSFKNYYEFIVGYSGSRGNGCDALLLSYGMFMFILEAERNCMVSTSVRSPEYQTHQTKSAYRDDSPSPGYEIIAVYGTQQSVWILKRFFRILGHMNPVHILLSLNIILSLFSQFHLYLFFKLSQLKYGIPIFIVCPIRSACPIYHILLLWSPK